MNRCAPALVAVALVEVKERPQSAPVTPMPPGTCGDGFRKLAGKPQASTAIGRHIFPGGELDHLGMSIANLERYGFEVHDVEAWREHYARTTRLWHDSLSANRVAAEREVGAVNTRLWIACLAAASIDFMRNSVGIFQTLASKRVRGPSGLPPSREHLYR